MKGIGKFQVLWMALLEGLAAVLYLLLPIKRDIVTHLCIAALLAAGIICLLIARVITRQADSLNRCLVGDGRSIKNAGNGTARTPSGLLYRIPGWLLAVLYVIVQAVFSVIIIVVRQYLSVSILVPALGSLVILAVFLCLLFGIMSQANMIENIEITGRIQTDNLRQMREEVQILISETEGNSARKALLTLSDDLRYSDPVSNIALSSYDEKVLTAIQQIDPGSGEEDILRQIEQVEQALKTRNHMCRELKEP